jgi:hypothetical protein
MNTGWICPRCQRVNAPWKEGCDCMPYCPWPIINPFPPQPSPYPIPSTGDPQTGQWTVTTVKTGEAICDSGKEAKE